MSFSHCNAYGAGDFKEFRLPLSVEQLESSMALSTVELDVVLSSELEFSAYIAAKVQYRRTPEHTYCSLEQFTFVTFVSFEALLG